MRGRLFVLAGCFMAAVVGSSALRAGGVATGTLQISLVVVASCSVQTEPLTFAAYKTGGASTGTATPGGIDVSCTKGTPAAVYVEGNRTLTGPNGNTVAYTLQANGQPWPAGQAVNVEGQGSSNAVHLTVTGSVAAGQQVALGNYGAAEVVRVIY